MDWSLLFRSLLTLILANNEEEGFLGLLTPPLTPLTPIPLDWIEAIRVSFFKATFLIGNLTVGRYFPDWTRSLRNPPPATIGVCFCSVSALAALSIAFERNDEGEGDLAFFLFDFFGYEDPGREFGDWGRVNAVDRASASLRPAVNETRFINILLSFISLI
jgi:hypothetical protein